MAKKPKSQKLHQQENSQNQESSSNSLNDPQQDPIDDNPQNIPQSQPDNTNIPFSQFQKSFTIFNKKNRSTQFKSYAKFKSDAAFDYFKRAYTLVSGLSFEQHIGQQNKYTHPPPMYQENLFVCQIPSNTAFFIHIYQVDSKKCQIRVMNSSGYVYAYFVEIRSCRRFCKIYNILKTINPQTINPFGEKNKSKHLFVIYDEIGCSQNQLNFVKKIADFAPQFCYYFHTHHNLQSQNKLSLNSQRKATNNKQSKQSKGNFLQQNNLFCFYSNIFQSNSSTPEENINKIIKVQDQIQNHSQFAFNSSQSSVDFILKSILTNYQKFSKSSDKNQMYCKFKKIIDNFGQTLQKKKQVLYGNPQDHYPQKMETCKQCVHCPFNKNRINKFLLEKQKSTSESNFFYDSGKQQVKEKAKNQKNKFQIPSSNKKQSKNVVHFKISDDEQDLNLKIHKSKYRCEGCTAAAKKDVPLCLECFGDYHIKKDKIKAKNMKKSAKKILLKKRLQALKQHNDMLQNEQNDRNLQTIEINDRIICENAQSQEICPICVEDSTSQIENQKQDFSIEQIFLAREILKTDKLNLLLDQINVERNNFMETFNELYSDPTTRKMATNIVEFVQLKLTELTFWDINNTKR